MNKQGIRLEIQNRIENLSRTQKQAQSKIVSEKIIKELEKKDFKVLVTYDAFADEVDISEVTRWATAKRKTVIEVHQSPDPMSLPDTDSIICIVP